MKIIRFTRIAIAALVLLAMGYWLCAEQIANPRVLREFIDHPNGERARRVMQLTLPSARRIPVSYLREDELVYAGADGSWWKELIGDGAPVTLVLRGETISGTARAVLDDPAYTQEVFERLRPNAIEGFGTLVEIRLGDRAFER